MTIWTQEQLYDIVKSNHAAIKSWESKPEMAAQTEVATKQTLQMEEWLDADLRYKLDEYLGRE